MNDRVTLKQKILESRLTNLEGQKYTERILSILFIAAFLFAIEGFLGSAEKLKLKLRSNILL